MLLVLTIVIGWAALVAAWIAALASASRVSFSAFAAVGRTRGGTVLLVALTGWVGAIYYWLVIRRQLEPHREAPSTLPPQYASPR